MKIKGITVCLLAIAVLAVTAVEANAQCNNCGGKLRSRIIANNGAYYNGPDAAGMSTSYFEGRVRPIASTRYSMRNHFSPQSGYTYRKAGITAQKTHMWNQSEAETHPWNEDYNYWRWNQPTALVVPPTAAYETSYAWGVGQVRSTPIHSQFGRGGAGVIGGGGATTNPPYWPSSTKQLGVYPVRAPW